MSPSFGLARHPNRTRRHWLVAIPVGIVLGVLVSVLAWRLTDNNGGTTRAPANVAAVWLFGFSTVRVDPEGAEVSRRLDETAFGSVAPASDAVFMYDPVAGRAGKLDAATNQFSERQLAERWKPEQQDETIAVSDRWLWLLTGPQTVARVDRNSLEVVAEQGLGGAGEAVLSASGRSVYALVGADRAEVVRLDETGKIDRRARADGLDAIGPTRRLEAAGDRVWIVGERGARALDGESLAPRGDVAMPAGATPIRDAVAVAGSLWVVADNGGALYQLRVGERPRRVALLPNRRPAFRGPVDVAAGHDAIWVLLPKAAVRNDRSAVLRRVDAAAARVTGSLDMPSELFVGGIAVT